MRTENATSAATAPRLTVFGIPQTAATSSVALHAGKLDGTLTSLAQSYPSISASEHPIQSLHALNPAAHFRLSTPTTTPEVLVDVVTQGDPQALKAELANLGMRNIAVYLNDVGGWLPVSQLANASALSEVHFARAAMPRTRSSMLATQGDFVQGSAAIRTTYPGLDGNGITVGVLSDSFNCFGVYGAAGSGVPASGYNGYARLGFTATYADDQVPTSGQATSTAALPGNVNVLEEADCLNYNAPYQLPDSDEGRAILQIVHAIAPGASLAFHTAITSEADFAQGITQLAAAGAKVIDDDVGYPDEPFFQDGLIADAVNTVYGQGVAYFSSAGNDGNLSYENTTPSFTIAGTGSQANEKVLNFDPSGASSTTSLPVSIPQLVPGEFITLIVEWDQPFVTGATGSSGSAASIDICLAGNSLLSTISSGTCTGGSKLGGDSVQLVTLGNPANATGLSAAENITVSIGMVNGGTAPGRVKFVVMDDGAGSAITSPYSTNSPTLQGHPGADGAAAVGAAFYFNTPACGASSVALETFSALAGDPILFNSNGGRLGTPIVRNKPDFVAPDGVNNTMLGGPLQNYVSTTVLNNVNASGTSSCRTNTSFPSFFGTSAAAPHAAALAALMLQAFPGMSGSQVISTLQSTAISMSTATPYDYHVGHGFIDAAAVFAGQTPSVVSVTVAPNPVVVGKTATLTWSGTGVSNCTAQGDWSGSSTTSGTTTVTPTATGTDNYTLTCTGSSGSSVTSTASLKVTSTSNTGGSTSATGGSGPFGGNSTPRKGGGALDLTTLLALSGVLLAGRALRRRLHV